MKDHRFPVITNIDREWALAQMPSWFQLESRSDIAEDVCDDGGWLDYRKPSNGQLEKPSWSDFVADEIEKFEAHYAGQQKTYVEWSSIWRKGWWPRVAPRERFPKSAPKIVCPFFRKGTPEFDRAFRLATEKEKRMWTRCGIAQFLPDDKRLKRIEGAA